MDTFWSKNNSCFYMYLREIKAVWGLDSRTRKDGIERRYLCG